MSRRLTALVTLGMLLGGNAYAGDGPARVSGPTPFEAGCAGETGPDTLYGNAEVQPHLAVNPRDPRHLLGTYQQDRWSGVAAQGVLTAASFDGGRTWRRSTAPVSECTGGTAGNGGDYKRATDSWVSISPDGTAHLATMSMTGGILEPGSETGIMVSRSADGGVTWGSTRTVIREGPPGFDDLPAVTADPADSRFVYLVWTRIRLLDETRFEGPAYLVRSTDGGRTWEPPQSIHHPGVNAQTVANKIVVLADGTLVNGFSQFSQDPVSLEVELEFGVVRSTDRGRTWSAPVLVADLTGIGAKDPDAGTPIRTGHEFVQLAADSRGNVYAAWQDARFSGGRRDGIVLSRSADGGRTWSTPVAVNGDPSVQAFSPALAVRHDGTVGVSYYDLRANTPDPATLPTKYWLAGSDDGGVTWSERSVAGPFDFAVAPEVERPAGALYLGDYHGLVASGKDFVPLFPVTTGNALNRTDIFTDGVAIR